MARGPKDILAQPLVSFELQAPAHITSIVCVPVGEGIENCFAVLDQSNRVYILSLMSLNLIWETECDNFVSRSFFDVSYGGELVLRMHWAR